MAVINSEIEKYNVDYYTQKTMEMFKHKSVSGCYTETGIRANIEAWMENKKDLFNLLRKHPAWNEEAKAIVFTNEEIRMPSKDEFTETFNELMYEAQHDSDLWNSLTETVVTTGPYTYNLRHVLNYFRSYAFEPNMNEQNTECVKASYPEIAEAIHISAGQKTSRVLNRLFKYCHINELPSYNRLFAKLSDSINPLKATKISVLSVNFLDYLLMSNGNSWSTCQTIVNHESCEGIYKAGVTSYANDKLTMVYYTLSPSYEGTDYCLEPKITRQLFFYKNNLLVQERLYPKTHDNDNTSSDISLVTQYRNVVENIIATCENKPNFWEKATVDICATSDSFMYRDWDNFPNWIYKIKGEDAPKRITVGSTSYCYKCGEARHFSCERDDSYECRDLYCNDCHYYIRCAHCGREIDTRRRRFGNRNYAVVNNKTYCLECDSIRYCNYHCCYELNDGNFVTLKGYGEVCKDAFDYFVSGHRIFKCSICGEYGLIICGDNIGMAILNNKPTCLDCLNELHITEFDETEMSYVS